MSEPAREDEALRGQGEVLHRRQEEALERLVAARTAQLSAANAALEAEVAERRRAEAAIRHDLARMMTLFAQGEARTRAIIESALDGIVLLGREGRIEGLNRAAERIFGCSKAEATGRVFLDEFIAPRSRSAVAQRISAGDGHEGAARSAPSDVQGLRRGGEEFPIECNVTRLDPISSGRRCAFVRDLPGSAQRDGAGVEGYGTITRATAPHTAPRSPPARTSSG
jgi:PAS domain S-box-containing protein